MRSRPLCVGSAASACRRHVGESACTAHLRANRRSGALAGKRPACQGRVRHARGPKATGRRHALGASPRKGRQRFALTAEGQRSTPPSGASCAGMPTLRRRQPKGLNLFAAAVGLRQTANPRVVLVTRKSGGRRLYPPGRARAAMDWRAEQLVALRVTTTSGGRRLPPLQPQKRRRPFTSISPSLRRTSGNSVLPAASEWRGRPKATRALDVATSTKTN